jgi:hypothetical protein
MDAALPRGRFPGALEDREQLCSCEPRAAAQRDAHRVLGRAHRLVVDAELPVASRGLRELSVGSEAQHPLDILCGHDVDRAALCPRPHERAVVEGPIDRAEAGRSMPPCSPRAKSEGPAAAPELLRLHREHPSRCVCDRVGSRRQAMRCQPRPVLRRFGASAHITRRCRRQRR